MPVSLLRLINVVVPLGADGKYRFDKTGVAGVYTIVARSNETDGYYAGFDSTTFTVFKHAAVIDSVVVPTVNTTVGQSVTVTVTMGNVSSGKVIIVIGGHEYAAEIGSGNVAVLLLVSTLLMLIMQDLISIMLLTC